MTPAPSLGPRSWHRSLSVRVAVLAVLAVLGVIGLVAVPGFLALRNLSQGNAARLVADSEAAFRAGSERLRALGAAQRQAREDAQLLTTREFAGATVKNVTELYYSRTHDLPFALYRGDEDAIKDALLAEARSLQELSRDRTETVLGELERRAARRRAEDAEALRAREDAEIAASVAALEERSRARQDDFAAAFRRLSVLLAALLVGVPALGLVAGLWRLVLAPVARLEEGAARIARGDWAARVPVRGADELGRLAARFNAMAEEVERAHAAQAAHLAALAAKQHEVEQLNAVLEDRVIAKTRQLQATVEQLTAANARLAAALDELRRTQRQLVHAETMASLGTLAGGVAHEFGNLLGGIIGCTEVAATAGDDDERRASLAMVQQAAERAQGIVRSLLDFARPRPPSRAPVAPAVLARQVGALLGPALARRGLAFECAIDEDLTIQADGGQLAQALLNLVTNALQHSEQGVIRVSARRAGDAVELRVADQGAGIAPEHQQRIFEPFFTTRTGDEHDPPGTGLGLSVTLGIARAHGGSLSVESAPGAGSTFVLTLPAE